MGVFKMVSSFARWQRKKKFNWTRLRFCILILIGMIQTGPKKCSSYHNWRFLEVACGEKGAKHQRYHPAGKAGAYIQWSCWFSLMSSSYYYFSSEYWIIESHSDLFHWIFPPLVQKELDEFAFWWNEHQVRPWPESKCHLDMFLQMHLNIWNFIMDLTASLKFLLIQWRSCVRS